MAVVVAARALVVVAVVVAAAAAVLVLVPVERPIETGGDGLGLFLVQQGDGLRAQEPPPMASSMS